MLFFVLGCNALGCMLYALGYRFVLFFAVCYRLYALGYRFRLYAIGCISFAIALCFFCFRLYALGYRFTLFFVLGCML
jgi:hypothetical protein